MCLRIRKIMFFGEVFLCGLETPVLKLQKNEFGLNEYVSVVEASSSGSPSSPPEQVIIVALRKNPNIAFMVIIVVIIIIIWLTHLCCSSKNQSDSELLVESYSEDENEEISKATRSSRDSWPGSQGSTVPAGEIRSLIERKEELERRQRKQERHRQRVQVSNFSIEKLKKDFFLILSVDEGNCKTKAFIRGCLIGGSPKLGKTEMVE